MQRITKGIPSYVGKGQQERFAAHGREAILGADESYEPGESQSKVDRIRAIHEEGLEPQILIVRH